VVEGFGAKSQNGVGDFIRIGKDVLRRNAQQLNCLTFQPFGSSVISIWSIPKIMRRAVDLDGELRRRAVEIEDICPDWMLPAEADVGSTQPDPQQLLRQRQLTPESSRILVGFVCSAHR
jgi:hypothetical protein